MPNVWPYSDLNVPGAGWAVGSNSTAHFSAMAAVSETGVRRHYGFGGAAFLGYHIAGAEDYYSARGRSQGRWAFLFTPNDRQNGTVGMTKGGFHSSGRRLLGDHDSTNGDKNPDIAVMHNTAFMADGVGRWIAGQSPAGFVFSDDGGSFTDESTDAASSAANDVLLLPSAAVAVNDALYIGAATTFSGVWIDQTTACTLSTSGSPTAVVLVLEYWDGGAWSTLAHSTAAGDLDAPFLFGDSGVVASSALTSAQQHRLVWDHGTDASDWATTTVNTQSAYWVRLRVSEGASNTGIGYVAPKARSVYLIEDSSQSSPLLPASYEVGNNPGTTAPSIKGWGLHRLDVNGTEQVSVSFGGSGSLTAGAVNVWYTWYDSTRDIETEPVSLGNYTVSLNGTMTATLGDHPDPNVDKIRFYFQGTGGTIAGEAQYEGISSTVGTGILRLVGQFSLSDSSWTITDLIGGGTNNERTTPWETIDLNRVGDGPYLASTIPNGIGLQPDVAAADGFYQTTCVHKGRIYCAGTDVEGYQNRVVWSIANNPYCFPQDNVVDLPMAGADRIVAIRAAGNGVVVLGVRSIWMITGDPESSNVAVQQIADVGCLARQSAITVGQRCFFLGGAGIYAVGSGGAVELVTPSLNRLFRDLYDSKINDVVWYQAIAGFACAGYDPSRETVYFALPGLLQLLTNSTYNGTYANDALIQIDLMTGRASILVGPSVACMATVPQGNAGHELWCGNYTGRLTRLTTDALDTNTTAAISGTVTGTHSGTTLQDTGLSLTASSSDASFVGQILYKVNAAGTAAEGRLIVSNDTDTFTVASAWTNNPVNGDAYYIGHYWASAETGDVTNEDPGSLHRMISARLHMESDMGAGNDLTVLSTPNLRSESTTWAAGGSAATDKAVQKLSLGADSGYTQRLRVLIRMGAARFRLFAIAVGRTLGGRADG